MKGADFANGSQTVRASATNGTHRSRKKNGAPKRSSEAIATLDISLPECLAVPVRVIEATPIDCPKWPLQAAVWLQPDGGPSAPVWSDLAVERQNRIPMPDFQSSGTVPFDHPAARYNSDDALRTAIRPTIPQSDLAPLGWDPRASCRKEGRE
jgi:hypothetical protein